MLVQFFFWVPEDMLLHSNMENRVFESPSNWRLWELLDLHALRIMVAFLDFEVLIQELNIDNQSCMSLPAALSKIEA